MTGVPMSTALSNPMITPEEKVFHPKPPRLRLPPRILRVNFTATSGMSDPIVQREKSKDKDREQVRSSTSSSSDRSGNEDDNKETEEPDYDEDDEKSD
jgi:hypothetical protein